MSQHSSLKLSGVGTRHRNVLKRYEKIKRLKLEDRWREDMSAFGLPKVKSLKVKVRKVKTAEAKPEEGAAVTPAAPAAPAAAKPAAAKTEAKPRAGK